jgi:hypothetical protein
MATHPTYRTAHGLTEEMKGHLARQGNVVLATINDDGPVGFQIVIVDEHILNNLYITPVDVPVLI